MSQLKPQQIGEVSRVGGWKGSPNSIASLLRQRVPIQDQRKCRRCRRVAVRGRDQCIGHIGRASKQPGGAGRAESRQLARLERLGLLPLELLALPVWRGLIGIDTARRAPLRLALVQAWDRRLIAPLRWATVQRQAIDLARQPGRRQAHTAWYYENR